MSEKSNYREFKLTTASLQNKNTVYLAIIILIVAGFIAYKAMPKEMFPDVKMPKIVVKTIYPGNPPADIENLVTRPLEKEIYTVKGIKKMSSSSAQDNSDISIDFNSGIDLKVALQDIKDAVDRAKSELPDDLPIDPMVIDIDLSEFPVLNVNLSGDFSVDELKYFAEYLEDEFEEVQQVSKAEIKGVEDKLIRINLDKDKMDVFELEFSDIETAISSENLSVSGGEIVLDNTRRAVRTVGEFKTMTDIENIIVKSDKGNIVYLRDVLENGKVVDGFKDVQSLARLDGEKVVSVQIIKKSGENLIVCIEEVTKIIAQAQKDKILPGNLNITLTNDQSDQVKKMISNLENSIIMGMLFVMWVLFFFLGTRNAVIVGLAIPMSMLVSFVVLGALDSTINMMVLFGLILALGMLVDNAIVVVENVHRFMSRGYSVFEAAKLAVGEIAWAIIASTATTLAAFIPLIFFPGMMGEFMKFLPITLVIVLSSSLFVALVLIPVVTVTFSSKEQKKPLQKRVLIITGVSVALAVIFYATGVFSPANLLMIVAIITILNYYVFYDISQWFQNVLLVWLEEKYTKILAFALNGRKPLALLTITFVFLILTILFMIARSPSVSLFPHNEPRYLITSVELPVGYDIHATDSIMRMVENDVDSIIKATKYDDIVESVLTTIGKGAVGENQMAFGNTPNKAICAINFVDFQYRNGKESSELLKSLSHELVGKYPGVKISISKNIMGPPTGRPVNIEIIGHDFNKLLEISDTVMFMIENSEIQGIEGLQKNLDEGQPELIVNIDRDKARRFGLSTGQIAVTIRTALFGKEVSDFKIGEDKYPIQIQLSEKNRNDIVSLMNQVITFRNKSGKFVHIPISAVTDFNYSTSYSAIKRIDNKRVVTVYSNVLEGANSTRINNQIRDLLDNYTFPEGYEYSLTGEQQDQQETSDFLLRALLIAVALILIIMVTQFNSVIKPFIIMASVLFSTIGVFGGIATFKMDFVIMMTGIGIISLAGVVVNNAIVLIDYIDYLKSLKKKELGILSTGNLPINEILPIVLEGGKTRLRPVLLTAITTILGLLPMATGFNIDFFGLLSDFKPNIYFGGDNAAFWGPMAWTVIFGLTFATFLTLVLVPVMYLLANRVKLLFVAKQNK